MEAGENDPSVATLEAYAKACGGELTILRGDGATLVKAIEALLPDERAVFLRLVQAAPKLDGATLSSLHAFADFVTASAARMDDQRNRERELG